MGIGKSKAFSSHFSFVFFFCFVVCLKVGSKSLSCAAHNWVAAIIVVATVNWFAYRRRVQVPFSDPFCHSLGMGLMSLGREASAWHTRRMRNAFRGLRDKSCPFDLIRVCLHFLKGTFYTEIVSRAAYQLIHCTVLWKAVWHIHLKVS